MSNKTRYLFFVTLAFFTLGFFNIAFAWLGFACMILPFVFIAKDGQKTWCKRYCPRASLFTFLFKERSLTGRPAPKWFTGTGVKWGVFAYFCFNLFVLTMSTVMVLRGRREPMEYLRFMIAFRLPWNMPQLVNLGSFPSWAVHLGFRVYSMMMTTTVVGLLLAWIYRPRTWCLVCPINTASDLALKGGN